MPAFITVPVHIRVDGYPKISSKVRIDSILSITPHVDSRYNAPGQTDYFVSGCEISLGSDHGVITSLTAEEVEALVEAAYEENARLDREHSNVGIRPDKLTITVDGPRGSGVTRIVNLLRELQSHTAISLVEDNIIDMSVVRDGSAG